MSRRGPSRVLATVPLHERSGGVAAVSRLVWQSFQSRWGDDAELITLRENDDTALSLKEKLRFGARVASSQIRRARWVFFGHLGPARVQSRFPTGWQRPYGVFLHGVEVWARLSDQDRAMLRHARVRIANSRHTARCTAELNADIGHIDICPLSMSPEQEAAIAARTPAPPESRDPVVLMVGRLNAAEAYKGHAEVIGAWPAVVAACPDARLVIAGEGDDRPRLEAMAHSTGVADRIEFTGFVSSEELDSLYERAALFALPSRGEGFGIVYLEAMARALPCLASRHDAAGDVVADGETGFLVSQDDRQDIAARIVTLLTNPGLRGRMGRAGVARVQTQFSFAQFSRGLIELLEARLEHFRMKVLHVIPAVAARYGGPSTAALGVCRALGRHGIDVMLATTDADGPGRLPVALETPVEFAGVKTMFFSKTASESFKYTWRLPRWLRRAIPGMDVVHIHGVMSHACVAAARICQRAAVPYVLAPIGTLDAASLAQKAGRKQLFLRLAGQRMVTGAASVQCTGDEELATLTGRFGARATLIPLGIDDDWLSRPARPAGDRRREIVCVSRLAPHKGLELLIDAFSVVTRNGHRDWGLTLAGSGDPAYVQSLRQRAGRSSAGPRIEFPGWVDGEEKRSLLSGAAVFALPSSHENFGLSVLEAMACGTPVIVSQEVQLARWVANGGAGWIAPLNAGDLGRTLQAAMSDAAERGVRGQAARDVASRFSWHAIAGEMVQLYRRVQAAPAAAAIGRAEAHPNAS